MGIERVHEHLKKFQAIEEGCHAYIDNPRTTYREPCDMEKIFDLHIDRINKRVRGCGNDFIIYVLENTHVDHMNDGLKCLHTVLLHVKRDLS